MHNNHYFLRQLSRSLEHSLQGFTLVSCFSQDKDELVIEFNNAERSFFLKCSLLPGVQCLSFPDSFRRARKNSIDLFLEVVMKKVTGVRQFVNERSLGLEIDEEYLLVFKMHGPQANVVLFKNRDVVAVFRHRLRADKELNPDLDREIDWSEDAFLADPDGARSRYFTFGKVVWNYLDEKGFGTAAPVDRWKMIVRVKHDLEHPRYYVIDAPGKTYLSLLPSEFSHREFTDPIKALNAFFHRYMSRTAFDKEKATLLSAVRGRITQGRAYQEKARQRLEELHADQHYTAWADLVMANLHRIAPGTAQVELEDFHDPVRRVMIRLRKDLTPQRNAEVFYRKAKNQSIEKRKLAETSAAKQKELDGWEELERALLSAQRSEDLQRVAARFASKEKEKEKQVSLPFHEHHYGGFIIRVGKNAAGNDALTSQHAHKDDLWLHAKDVAGSHVIIRHQAGKNFPREVIAYAASLAAFHSKRRNESLCPVSVTPAKYVRKRKGDPPGAVIVQREDVVMAVPADAGGRQ